MKTLRIEKRSRRIPLKIILRFLVLGFLSLSVACNWKFMNEDSYHNSPVKIEQSNGSAHYADFMADIIASGLIAPWTIGFLPNGNAIVAERNGRLRMVIDIIGRPRLIAEPIAEVQSANTPPGALLGIAIHPDFINNRMFYLCITLPEDGLLINRIERWQLSADGKYALQESIVYSEIVPAEMPPKGHGGKGLLFAGLMP